MALKFDWLRSGVFWKTPYPTAAVLLLLLVVLEVGGLIPAVDRLVFDQLCKLRAQTLQPDADGMLIMVDEKALERVSRERGYRWPWPRDVFAGLFLALKQDGASVVAVDMTFLEESENAENDLILGAVAAACEGVYLARVEGKVPVVWQDEYLANDPRWKVNERMGLVNYTADPDGVLRAYRFDKSLAGVAANHFPDKTVEMSSYQWGLLSWYGDLSKLTRLGIALSAENFVRRGILILEEMKQQGVDLFEPEQVREALKKLPPGVGSSLLQGKTVFLGTNASGTYDMKAFPISHRDPGVLAHYTAWSNLRQNSWIEEWVLAKGVSGGFVLGVLIIFGTLAIGWQGTSLRSLLLGTLGPILLLVGATWGLIKMDYFLAPSSGTVALFLGVTTVTARNWWIEGQKKKEVRELFGNYVSSHVVDQLLENPERLRLGGEKKELTVFFSDVAGFTDLSEKIPPEELVDVVNHYLSEQSDFIIDQDGYLDKYIGDAIMGVFGAPQELDNHALAGCMAAILSRDHLVGLSERLLEKTGSRLGARYGVNTGEMVVGNFGSTRKRNYTVVGDAVNLAARLEAANKQFGTTILIGERTKELAGGQLLYRPVDFLAVKGKEKPVQTYEVIGVVEDLPQEKVDFIEQYMMSYELYRQRQFAEAEKGFVSLLERQPEDKLCEIFAQRAKFYTFQPPPKDWDGVHRLKSK